MAYCGAMESLSECRVSPRADALAAVALELERLANHVGDLGALSQDIGILACLGLFRKNAGRIFKSMMELTGSRFGRSFCRPGGVLLIWMRPWSMDSGGSS